MTMRRGTAALLMDTAKDQGEDILNKNMNESSAKTQSKPDWSPDQRQHSHKAHTNSIRKKMTAQFL